ncbi:MAG: matrixin family metalloprotease [Planctomycetota bacterium]
MPPGTQARFTIRGRLENPRRVSFRVEPAPSPLDGTAFARAVERAAATWNGTGVVAFVPAGEDERPTVTLGFRRGGHDRCPPFGTGVDVAHTGPVAPGTFVHFDAARTWSENGGGGAVALYDTAVHELGHVLGLDHSEADDAVMGTAAQRPPALSGHDLTGLCSLYGGGDDGPGDLRIARDDAATAAVLRRVAPAATTAFAVFDTDGDEDAEVLVWRTDRDGHGELMIYHFTRGPLLARTLGPFPGAVGPDARVSFAVGDDHERWLFVDFANGARTVRAFTADGDLGQPRRQPSAAELARAATPTTGDLDGDGHVETVSRR